MAPVIAGKCQMESLLNGALTIDDIALLNDALAVHADNEILAQELRNRGR